MRRSPSMTNGAPVIRNRDAWSGIALIAALYFYFLIFAQFAFLALVREDGVGTAQQKLILGLMALAGLGGSASAAGLVPRWGALGVLRLGLILAGVTAILAPLPVWFGWHSLLAVGIGLGLGWATVSLVAVLPDLLGAKNWGWKLGLGTGSAYGLCNVPPIFQADAAVQAALAAAFVLLAALLPPRREVPVRSDSHPAPTDSPLPLWAAVMSFVVLVWYDSAAFYIIQQADALKGGTWGENALLIRNGLLHFIAACVAGWTLSRTNLRWYLLAALGWLALAGLMVNEAATRRLGGALYPVGVSLYSVCLLAYPAFLSGASTPALRARHAAWIFSLAGWAASALGIGMAEHLHQVPLAFVLTTLVFMLPIHGWDWLRRHRVEKAVVAAMALLAWPAFSRSGSDKHPGEKASAVELGRRVYIGEGCVHCHSQYVRPGTLDEMRWGPAQEWETLMEGQPPLFGNRRQGPDLLRVANRRSRAWLEQHFRDPPSLSPRSSMPCYAHLFDDERGPALIAYLNSLAQGTLLKRQATVREWRPDAVLVTGERHEAAERETGRALFGEHCSMCHGLEDDVRGALSERFPRAAGPLWERPFLRVPPAAGAEERRLALARIIKFGLPGTEMPGHEYLTDSDIASLARFVSE